MAAAKDEIVFYHYAASIFSHRILWYLRLRALKYTECIQPAIMPRPDLELLNVRYRRIPILAIGGDVYCDTRIILDALEKKFPPSSLTPKTSAEKGVQKLFESHTIFGGLFWRAVTLLPVWKDFLKDPNFRADRSEMLGATWDADAMTQERPEAMAHLRAAFQLMEDTFLADGRKWVLGNDENPSIADIDAIWPLQWVVRDPLMEGTLPAGIIDTKHFPKTFSWMERFFDAVDKGEAKAPKPTTVDGEEAAKKILDNIGGEFDTEITNGEPVEVQLGEVVQVCPTDTGTGHVDEGILVTLNNYEICIMNNKKIRIHFPRWNFRITPVMSKNPAQPSQEPSSKKMTLIYHPLSPYSRKAYMLARELKLDSNIALDRVVVAPVNYPGWSDDNDRVSKYNPMTKIPTLVPDKHGDGIYDSRTITDYLLNQAQVKPVESSDEVQKWRLRTLHACADGILDAQALLVYENKIRGEKGMKLDAWVEGQTAKMTRGLDRLEFEANRGTLQTLDADQVATVADIAIACALGFMDIMGHDWSSKRPKLANWFEVWRKRESFDKTRPDIDWKTGGPGDMGFGSEAISAAKT